MSASSIAVCPFCGHDDPEIDNVSLALDTEGRQALVHALVCPGCGCIGPHDPAVAQSAEEALKRWADRVA